MLARRLGDELHVLGVTSDPTPHERTVGQHFEVAPTSVVQREANQRGAGALPFERVINLRVDEGYATEVEPIDGLPARAVVREQLVARFRRVVENVEPHESSREV